MPDWNLALIDAATAWVVVAIPRALQAHLITRSGLYTDEALTALGIDERRRVDPVKHTGFFTTLLLPVACSLAGIPVLAAGKGIEVGHLTQGSPGISPAAQHALSNQRQRLATKLWLTTSLAYLAQSIVMALLMLLLAKVYLAGAPVAARCGQLCLRLALVNLLPLPPLDSALASWVWRGAQPSTWWLRGIIPIAVLLVLIKSPALRLVDQAVALGFFLLSRSPFL